MGRRSFKTIRYLVNSILAIIYGLEDKCIICGGQEEENYLCNTCEKNMNIINLRYSLDHEGQEFHCYSLGFYSYGLKKLILAFKYNKDFLAGKVLGRYLSDFILNEIDEDIDLLTFIPSSKASLKKRGFNQCEVLCNFISINSNIDYDALIYKVSESVDQIGLDNNKRWENVAESFKFNDKNKVEGKTILIIDDVVTSGATAFYAAKVLHEAKAKKVFILTAAKSRI